VTVLTTGVYEWVKYSELITAHRKHVSPQYIDLASDSLIRVGLSTAPIAVALILVIITFLPVTRRDLRVLIGRQRVSRESFNHEHQHAVRRLQILAIAITGAIACGSWMQDVVTNRARLSRHLYAEYSMLTCGAYALKSSDHQPSETRVEGIEVNPAAVPEKVDSCTLCPVMIDWGNAARPPAFRPAQLFPLPEYPLTYVPAGIGTGQLCSELAPSEVRGEVRMLLNFIETVLYARRDKAISETEFLSLWAGPVDRVLTELDRHMEHGRSAWARYLMHTSPLLVQQFEWGGTALAEEALAVAKERGVAHQEPASITR